MQKLPICSKWVTRIIQEVLIPHFRWKQHVTVFLQIGKLTDTDDYDICVNLVDNEETLDLNRKLRNKDKPADVLSIPLHPVTKHLNEIIIILTFSFKKG